MMKNPPRVIEGLEPRGRSIPNGLPSHGKLAADVRGFHMNRHLFVGVKIQCAGKLSIPGVLGSDEAAANEGVDHGIHQRREREERVYQLVCPDSKPQGGHGVNGYS